MPVQYTGDKIYLGGNYGTGPAARTAIIDAINQGRQLISYIGHASPQWWAVEKIFQNNDLSALTNTDKLPFFSTMTYLDGYYINQTTQSLAESLVRAPNKGAIASWSPTGLGVATAHDVLEKGLFESMLINRVAEAGAATTQAKYYFFTNTWGYLDLIDTYLLFGDPATSLKLTAPLTSPIYIPLIRR